ncbi:Cob(I)yrinic acid a,c-diamide adenosyltransferase [mine drainage metagenome]|uniref:Cob(I)yrinic acid a,c-diamide adenosyltransferase n=1 Tax=mine drainage metagenome TaxID=410659 RepID=A0A1J5PK13_9ZZZZ
MSRTSKNDPRLEAYATVDEANSHLGVVLSLGQPEEDVAALLLRIQNDLFDVGADLCVPVIDQPAVEPLRVTTEQVEALENAIDKYNAELSSLRSFILPGGNGTAALLHVVRTVVRRAEREAWTAINAFGDGVNPLTARYLNRLSDLLFVLARYANRREGDQLWVPGANR